MKNNIIRHGEIVIREITSLPDDLEQIFEGKGFIIGHSETGHHHVLDVNAVIYKPLSMEWRPSQYQEICKAVFGDAENQWPSEITLFRAKSDGKVVHQKTFDVHEPLDVMKGLYLKYTKRKFNYFTGLLERVRD